tara:strand:- start:7134 stop:7331 length:198 start_codon:yes stop_codon:yes gene_type:complete
LVYCGVFIDQIILAVRRIEDVRRGGLKFSRPDGLGARVVQQEKFVVGQYIAKLRATDVKQTEVAG